MPRADEIRRKRTSGKGALATEATEASVRSEEPSSAPEAKTAPQSPRPVLIRHPNANGGALYAGGVPGNAGGSGRPLSAARNAARESFASRIPVLESIADGNADVTFGRRVLRAVIAPKRPSAFRFGRRRRTGLRR